MSWPQMAAVPDVGGMNPVIIRMVVDFPAPFGPRKPSTSPFSTAKEMPLTASKLPKRFFRLSTLSMFFLLFVLTEMSFSRGRRHPSRKMWRIFYKNAGRFVQYVTKL